MNLIFKHCKQLSHSLEPFSMIHCNYFNVSDVSTRKQMNASKIEPLAYIGFITAVYEHRSDEVILCSRLHAFGQIKYSKKRIQSSFVIFSPIFFFTLNVQTFKKTHSTNKKEN